jgi:hypothetical protein
VGHDHAATRAVTPDMARKFANSLKARAYVIFSFIVFSVPQIGASATQPKTADGKLSLRASPFTRDRRWQRKLLQQAHPSMF